MWGLLCVFNITVVLSFACNRTPDWFRCFKRTLPAHWAEKVQRQDWLQVSTNLAAKQHHPGPGFFVPC